MRVFQVQDDWSMENLRMAERSEPQAGPGQVLLRMRAASLNYRDLLVPKRGYGALTGTLPLIPISDGVGYVVAIGNGVTRVRVGDRVCPIMIQSWISGEATAERVRQTLGGPLDGVMTELMVVDAEGVVRVPPHLTDAEAAALPCAALTAWSAVVTHGGVRAGDVVLVQGCGGVSLFALQFAKLHGARVIILSSSDARLERAQAMGADVGINYRTTPEWGRVVREQAGGDGVDQVIEVGGSATLPQSLRAVRAGGTISLIGVLSGAKIDAALGPIVTRQVRLQGIACGSRDGFEAMLRAIAEHHLRPAIDR
ncbi:MAG TPA: NAD(P)-dependent alcohol dehydrogenase, partial [Candidatus Defluviicoccus seviourii]|nr:NAD(P)-dependent alcohol dehydrogenase [Candidatus Defluviicoccus seviourii]